MMEQPVMLTKDKAYQLSLKKLVHNTFQIEKDLFYHKSLCLYLFGNFSSEKLLFPVEIT